MLVQHDQETHREEGLYVPHISITVHQSRELGLELNRTETLKQELRGGHGGMLPIGLLACFHIEPRTTSPRTASLTINHYIRKWPSTARTNGGIFSVEVPPFRGHEHISS